MYNYDKAKEILGDKVIVIAIEEMAELTQQLTKGLRGKMNREDLLEDYYFMFYLKTLLRLNIMVYLPIEIRKLLLSYVES